MLTGRAVRVVFGEVHFCFEIAAVVEGIRVQDDERYAPVVYVVVDEL
jgi:hypothetical protein